MAINDNDHQVMGVIDYGQYAARRPCPTCGCCPTCGNGRITAPLERREIQPWRPNETVPQAQPTVVWR